MTEYRASFDAAISFSNGGDLTARGFRVDVPSPDVGEAGIAALFVASLGLLMTDTVELSNVKVFAEPHKGTDPASRRAGPGRRGDWPVSTRTKGLPPWLHPGLELRQGPHARVDDHRRHGGLRRCLADRTISAWRG